MAALGITPAAWEAADRGWTERIEHDVVVATMYGQLFSQVGACRSRPPAERAARYRPGMPQDPVAMARAVQAIMAQAGAWLTRTRATSPRAASASRRRTCPWSPPPRPRTRYRRHPPTGGAAAEAERVQPAGADPDTPRPASLPTTRG